VQPFSQVSVLVLQTPDSQLAPAVHCTQVNVVALQTAVVPVQAPVSPVLHCTQAFVAGLQAGALAGQPVRLVLVHCTHVFVVVLQAGVPPASGAGQFESWTHWTHWPVAPLQMRFGY
jgi:hypothetical protein